MSLIAKRGVFHTDLLRPLELLSAENTYLYGDVQYVLWRFINNYSNPIRSADTSTPRGLYLRIRSDSEKHEYYSLVGLDVKGDPGSPEFLRDGPDIDVVIKHLYDASASLGLNSNPQDARETVYFDEKKGEAIVTISLKDLSDMLDNGQIEIVAHSKPIVPMLDLDTSALENALVDVQKFNRKWALKKNLKPFRKSDGYFRMPKISGSGRNPSSHIFDREIVAQGIALSPAKEDGASIVSRVLGMRLTTDEYIPMANVVDSKFASAFPNVKIDLALVRTSNIETAIEKVNRNINIFNLSDSFSKYLRAGEKLVVAAGGRKSTLPKFFKGLNVLEPLSEQLLPTTEATPLVTALQLILASDKDPDLLKGKNTEWKQAWFEPRLLENDIPGILITFRDSIDKTGQVEADVLTPPSAKPEPPRKEDETSSVGLTTSSWVALQMETAPWKVSFRSGST